MTKLWLCGGCFAVMASAQADAIDKLVKSEMAKAKIPGLAVLVIRNGQAVKERGYGDANLEFHAKVTPDTVFESGSVGKQFTSALVLMLAQKGKLSLNDSITKYFPEGKGLWDGVRVRHLLSHTSGIGDMPYDKMDLRKDYSEADLVKLMTKQPIVELPGEKWRYNNGGYVLLGILIHRVTGKFYGEEMKKLIFDPLGMKTARVINESDIVSNRASGYELENGKVRNQRWVSPSLNTTADGSLYVSLNDMKKWDAALYTGRLLTKESLARMWSPTELLDGTRAVVNPGGKQPVCYGFGWTVAKKGPYQCVAHGGAWQGFRSYIARIPQIHLSIVVLANLGEADAPSIAKSILETYEPRLKDGTKTADRDIP
jgi:CubicO group peptidase (beta-lactamase class C family)